MMSVGIDKQINCYSMVPWELSFQYYDQATNSLQFVKTAPGEAAYEEMWGAMLASFSKHLKEKGWFDICAIAMARADKIDGLLAEYQEKHPNQITAQVIADFLARD